MSSLNHPILEASFATIDREIGEHSFTPREYAIVRRIIHATADFEFAKLTYFSPDAIERGIIALRDGVPIVVDVSMIRQGIASMVRKTFGNAIVTAIDRCDVPLPGKTRTETGLLRCFAEYPEAIYAIGNAPTALLALCQACEKGDRQPALIIGSPVGFINVVESKHILAQTNLAQIRIDGRKGGSPATSAILNALLILAWEKQL
ncbi:cobalt-precorrin-8X methylmutase [Spirulina sp. 06S082]|uniref:cobalt-precorrin-8X methylmutase n=1 Tax=Spirulina sp. 06S082 TaxID=3110248 RepID=UPI002B1EAA36|nr:cobalt-precorrin-8X methylmutase [Spirulina sp. 06S082]MEA5472186.1 cobalt-precorrin-8X methylmutase [Spirulina sp. 06S082]